MGGRGTDAGTVSVFRSVSGRPGVYFSARIDNGGAAPLGVVVAKVELDAVEADWRDGGQPVFVADAHGIVLATSQPAWRFLALRPIAPLEAAGIRESLQFGTAPLRIIRPEYERRLETWQAWNDLSVRAQGGSAAAV